MGLIIIFIVEYDKVYKGLLFLFYNFKMVSNEKSLSESVSRGKYIGEKLEKNYFAFLIKEEIGDGPFDLVAPNSDWNGQTGHAQAEDAKEVVDKVLSFGGSRISLWKEPTGVLYITTATHDAPLGFAIEIKQIPETVKIVVKNIQYFEISIPGEEAEEDIQQWIDYNFDPNTAEQINDDCYEFYEIVEN